MTLPIDTDIRLIRAIRRRWPNRDERARALGMSTRQLSRWEYGGELPGLINKLAELGLIAVVDELPRPHMVCTPDAQPADQA